MKIKVTFEKEFDSLDFFDESFDCSEKEFKNAIFKQLAKDINVNESFIKIEIIEND